MESAITGLARGIDRYSGGSGAATLCPDGLLGAEGDGAASLSRRWLSWLGLGELPALTHEGFRLLWHGQSISLVGTTMHNAAVLWHVAQLASTGERAMALGMVGLVRVVPLLGLSLLGGMAADRYDRRKLMLTTQGLLAALAALMAALTLSGHVSLLWIYILTALKAAATAFDSPARSSLVPRLVPREHLPNAVNLNTTLFQVTSLIGPALAGLALIRMSIGWVYVINALSFLGVIGALLRIRPLPEPAASAPAGRGWRSMAEGLRCVFENRLVRSSMLLDFFAGFFGSATVLMPIFASEVLQVGPAGFGCLCAAPSVGAILASLVLLRLEKKVERRGLLLIWAVSGYGIATVMFGLTTTFSLALICLGAIGACDTINMVLRNVIKQLATPDALRGRMNGAQVLFAQGGPQLGEMEAGLVAQAVGASGSVISGGVGCLIATAWIAWRSPELRRSRRVRAAVPGSQPPSLAQAA